MQRFLPSLWLLAATLYAAATLFLDHALFAAAPPPQVAVHETVVAKQPARLPDCASLRPRSRLPPLGLALVAT